MRMLLRNGRVCSLAVNFTRRYGLTMRTVGAKAFALLIIAASAPAGLAEDKPVWWSLAPLRKSAIPPLSNSDGASARNPIDTFILAKLREKGLESSPEADRRTLVRRLYFDLLGLPPTYAELEQAR